MSMNCATSSTKASVVAHNGHATTCTANVDHLIMWRVWCVGCVCTCGVVCGVWVVVVRVCGVCGEAWHTLSLLFSLLPLLFPFLFLSYLYFSLFFSFSFSFSFSLAPSLTLALALVLSLSLLSSFFPSTHSSLLYKTLYKALINKHGVLL